MKLIYRGAAYNYEPNQTSIENTGRPVRSAQRFQAPYPVIYRGLTALVNPEAVPNWADNLPANFNLLYRGVALRVNRHADGRAIATAQRSSTKRVNSTVLSSVMLAAANSNPTVGKVHQANLLSNVQRRLDVARERGDMALVALLESERQQIAA